MSLSITIATREDLFPLVHGAAVKIVRTAEALSRNGCDVTVVTGDRLRYHRFQDGRHEVMSYPPRFVAATRMPPRLRPALERLGVPDYWKTVAYLLDTLGYPADEHLLYRPIVDPDFWLRTLYVGLRHRTDWFQAEFPGFGVPCWVAARLLRRRCSVVLHNVEWKRLADTTDLGEDAIARLSEIETQICHLADEVVTCSVADRDLLLPRDFERYEVTVIPHGIDLENYRWATGAGIREAHGIPSDCALLFFHGTLHYQPNTVACRLFAEEILPRLARRGRRVKVLAAGLGAPAAHKHPDLVYAGCVDDLPGYVAASDVCAVPLLGGGGTRMKILEYFASRKPVVSTRKGAEGLESGNGRELLLVPDGDWDGFCDRIEQLLDDPELAAGMGEMGRRFVERFDWLEVGRAFVELYRGRERVRGTDFGSAFAGTGQGKGGPAAAGDAGGRGGDDEAVREAGRQRLAALERERAKALDKERRNNASPLVRDGRMPARVRWDEADVRRELSEDDIVGHIPAPIAWQKPRTLIMLLGKRCNLRCSFCGLWESTDLMPFEDVMTVLSRALAAGVRTVVLTGGEPMLHPRIFEIVEASKALGLGVNMTTNGTLLERNMERLAASRIDSLSISLDGFGQTHDALRGAPGTFESVMRAIDLLRAGTAIHLNVYFVVTRDNVTELTRAYDMAVERGIGFDFWPVNGYPDLGVTEARDRAAYEAALERIARTDEKVAARLDYYRYGLEYMAGRRDRLRCLGLIEQIAVDSEGNLVPCCVWDVRDLRAGNALERPLDELLFSRKAQEIRERIFREGCLDRCFNHSLYEFQAATGLSFVLGPGDEGPASARETAPGDRRRAAGRGHWAGRARAGRSGRRG